MRGSRREAVEEGAEGEGHRAAERRSRSRRLRGCAALFLVLAGTSCETIVGGGNAESEVRVVGAFSEEGASPGESPFTGTVRVRLRVFLLGGSGFPISLSGVDREVEVDVRGAVPVSLGTHFLVPGLYQGLRVVITEAGAELEAGLGDGSQGGSVAVNLGPDPLTIDSGSSIVVRDDARLVVTVDLSASDWLAAVASAPPPRTVSRALFASFVSLRVRVE